MLNFPPESEDTQPREEPTLKKADGAGALNGGGEPSGEQYWHPATKRKRGSEESQDDGPAAELVCGQECPWPAIVVALTSACRDALIVVDRQNLEFILANHCFSQMFGINEQQQALVPVLKGLLSRIMSPHRSGVLDQKFQGLLGHMQIDLCVTAQDGSSFAVVTVARATTSLTAALNTASSRIIELTQMVEYLQSALRSSQSNFQPCFPVAKLPFEWQEVPTLAPTSSVPALATASAQTISAHPAQQKEATPPEFVAGLAVKDDPPPTDTRKSQVTQGHKVCRKPYRFCMFCWIMKKEWLVKSLTTPEGKRLQINNHEQLSCPLWPLDLDPTAEQQRAYGAAFKRAVRQNTLHHIAMKTCQTHFPYMSEEELNTYLIAGQL